MTWINAPECTPTKYLGFVYRITELSTGMIYIGQTKMWYIEKKNPTKFVMKDGKHVKDKLGKRIPCTRTTKKHTRKETAWRDYNSSSNILQEKIKNNPNNFKKEILRLCESKMDMNCWETYIQLGYWASGEWHKLYNECINIRGRILK